MRTKTVLLGVIALAGALTNQPVFTRRDVRVPLDRGAKLPVPGVRAPSLRGFPREKFSVSWTGQLAARFDEAYAFALKVDGGQAQLWIDGRPGGTQPVRLGANVPVAVKLEYRQGCHFP